MAALCCTVFLAAAAFCGNLDLASATLPRPDRPNVLLIISDDLRPQIDAAGFGGAPLVHTPNLRALSERSASFTRAYAQEALCGPSRNSFLTGRRPDTTKAWQFVDHFREDGKKWTSLPQLFKEAGWTTVGSGKVFHPGLPPNFDLPISWDERMSDGSWDEWLYPSEPRCPDRTAWCAVDDATNTTFQDSDISTAAIRLLRNVSGEGKPFFLAAGFRKPHLQWRFPARILSQYPLSEIPLPAHRTFPEGAPLLAFHQPFDDFLGAFSDTLACGGLEVGPQSPFADECQRHWRRAYWASVSFVDEQIGLLLSELESLGHADDTIVAVVGDHGWQLGEMGEWEKFTNFELATRTPLLLAVPWATGGGAVRDAPVELVDLMPTIAELAGVAPPERDAHPLEGTSLVPLIANASAQPARRAYSQFPRCVGGLNFDLEQPGLPACAAGRAAVELPAWCLNNCNGVDRRNFTHMGLSMRTPRWRVTKWYAGVSKHPARAHAPAWLAPLRRPPAWDGAALRPAWDAAISTNAVELYDHLGDDGMSFDGDYEALNLAGEASLAPLVARLVSEMETAFGR